MKKFYFVLLIVLALSASPALAASQSAAAAKAAWKPLTPKGFIPITWAKAPGIASYFKAPADNGAIDFLTRIYLPQNQIDFIASTSTPLGTSSQSVATSSGSANDDISDLPNLSFQRLAAEAAKTISPAVKFIWDAPFFNLKPILSELSLAVKYSVGTTTAVSSGSRSVPDMAQSRRLLTVNNQSGQAAITDFDPAVFLDNKNSDLALEGFNPSVLKTDSAGGGASRLFLGVSVDGRELAIYCSQLATVGEASDALTAAGIPLDRQLEADGGGSAACGYNLPGQFFVEPTRSLPLLMGAETIVARGTVTTKTINVRSGPATKYPIVVKFPKDTAVRAFEEKNGWYRIGAGEWVLGSLIKS